MVHWWWDDHCDSPSLSSLKGSQVKWMWRESPGTFFYLSLSFCIVTAQVYSGYLSFPNLDRKVPIGQSFSPRTHSAFLFDFAVIDSLSNLSVRIPEYIQNGQTADLTCSFNVGGDQLYSVKWYKGRHEFYRYMPGQEPVIKTFPVKGMEINVSTKKSAIFCRHCWLFTRFFRCQKGTLFDSDGYWVLKIQASITLFWL